MNPTHTVTEAELHASIDGQLSPGRRLEVEAYLAAHPEEARRMQSYQAQKQALRDLYNPVMDEKISAHLQYAAKPPRPWHLQRIAAGIVIAISSAGSAWVARGLADENTLQTAFIQRSVGDYAPHKLADFARRAAVAHVVYSPDTRRPVEVGADQAQQLENWLSNRLGAPIKPPSLQSVGYTLIGGRLLPGERGPVAQLMYHDASGQRLTLYVTQEIPSTQATTDFQFGQDGPVNVFYWVDKSMGYAISSGTAQADLLRVAKFVHQQKIMM
ncbi:anti-sigma factor [Iodobacter sp.]|uniref:anti-sigma factor family protein n=1 Tax=Iodobacter sp. TaxID=1915058 RepID=UPI0025D8880D|nr:anti-sigma factor [Iodobacter sp.]